MKKIKLSNGKYTSVDDEKFDMLNKFRWSVNKGGYVNRKKYLGGGKKNPKTERIFLHHLVLGRKNGYLTDHINRNPLDNRLLNLRFCTSSENCMNRKIEIRNKSGYKGVSWNKNMKKWRARIGISNKKIVLGYFDDLKEAALAYNKAATKYFGEFALLNNII